MSFLISFTGLNDLKVLNSDAFHALDDGADIREVTRKLIYDISNEAAQIFGYDRITVAQKWLRIQWDLTRPVTFFYNAGIYSATGELIYNPLFLADVINRYGKEVLVGILAHEVGHRMVYLLLTQHGHRVSSWENEHCADYIAGLLMRLGQCSSQAMRRFYLEACAQESRTHPSGRSRADIFLKGYRMIDQHTETAVLRNTFFMSRVNPRLIFTSEFVRECLLTDVLNRPQRTGRG